MPDGDFLDLDWVGESHAAPSSWPPEAGQRQASQTPLLVLFHGLEGSSRSHYARALMHAVAARGWHGVVVHFRGCSGRPNNLPRAYHSGDTADIDYVLSHLRQRHADICAVGVSLGGNALLKWLAEQGQTSGLRGAAAVSVPYDLAAANHMLSRGVGRLYSRHFLRSLIPSALAKAQRFPNHPGLQQLDAIRQARTLRDFDDAVTAPLHGFADAADYYQRSSCGQYLHAIRTPTLLVHASNDPFLPASAIPAPGQLPACVQLALTAAGGHVGFVNGGLPGQLDWLPQRLLVHMAHCIQQNRVA